LDRVEIRGLAFHCLHPTEVFASLAIDRLDGFQLACLRLKFVDAVDEAGKQLFISRVQENEPILRVGLAGRALAVNENQSVAEQIVAELRFGDTQVLQDRLDNVLDLLRFRRLLKLLEQRRFSESRQERGIASDLR